MTMLNSTVTEARKWHILNDVCLQWYVISEKQESADKKQNLYLFYQTFRFLWQCKCRVFSFFGLIDSCCIQHSCLISDVINYNILVFIKHFIQHATQNDRHWNELFLTFNSMIDHRQSQSTQTMFISMHNKGNIARLPYKNKSCALCVNVSCNHEYIYLFRDWVMCYSSNSLMLCFSLIAIQGILRNTH